VPCQWKCASSLISRLFNRSELSVNIPWNWRQNCKHTSLSWLLKEWKICNLYGWTFRSLSRMCHTLLSDMPIAWVCLCAVRLGLWLMDANIQAMFSGMQTEDSWPSGFLHMKQPSTCHCLTQQPTAIWRWCFLLIEFTEKSAPSLCNWPCPNKQFHSTHVL